MTRRLIPYLWLVAGVASGIALHYFFYRFGIPSKPFIYVSF